MVVGLTSKCVPSLASDFPARYILAARVTWALVSLRVAGLVFTLFRLR